MIAVKSLMAASRDCSRRGAAGRAQKRGRVGEHPRKAEAYVVQAQLLRRLSQLARRPVATALPVRFVLGPVVLFHPVPLALLERHIAPVIAARPRHPCRPQCSSAATRWQRCHQLRACLPAP